MMREGKVAKLGAMAWKTVLAFCADVRPDVEVSHEWVPDLGPGGRGVTLPNRATPGRP